MYTTARSRFFRQIARVIPRCRTYAFSANDNKEINTPNPPKAVPNVSKTNERAIETHQRDEALQESVEEGEKKRVMQAPNRQGIWSRSQNPREKALTGPRFEQTIMEYQPAPEAAIELIHKQPVRWVHHRVAECDGGGGPLGHPKIFINTDKPQICMCTYCGLPFANEHHRAHLEALPDTSYPLAPQGHPAEVPESQRISGELLLGTLTAWQNNPRALELIYIVPLYLDRLQVRNSPLAEMSTITSSALQTSYPPIIPYPFNANQPKTIRLYPLSNYTFGTKETQPEEDPSVIARLKRLEEHYVEHGMRRTCEGILVCHEHNHPHILMLQIANAFFKLPGDYLKAEDSEIEGFKARLNERLAPSGKQFSGEGVNEEWEIGDTLAQWWRPNFETFMYPFIPAHVTRPKECKKLYFIQLPRQKVLSVPKNMKLLAVPLFELYDNTARYGPQLSAIPHLLSKYNFEFVDEKGEVVAITPGLASDGYVPKTKILAGGDEEMKEGSFKIENGIQ